MKNKLLSKGLAKYYDLLSAEEVAKNQGIDVEDILKDYEFVAEYTGVEIVGTLSIKSGYEDRTWECDGSFYGDDGLIYYMYGYPQTCVISHDEEDALARIVKL